ncbi:MAG TPA: tripartite tricarboxylate transporter substrate binding protein [Alphaproteobacteria bacterium]|nr:tripartite tricarboxylate transporter substrate binding protein [Alphaproteobacteria bacterium]
MFSKRILHTAVFAAASALALGVGSTGALAYPDKAVTVYVGAGAGGSTDAGARIVAQAMEKILGQPMVVVNKPGGGGSKALALLKKEKPDGYTVAYAFAHHVGFQPHYRRAKSLYWAKDFDYIGSVTVPHQSIVSLAGRGWKTLSEMAAKLKEENKPLRLVYSGGPGRLVGEAIGAHYGIPAQIIRVRGGGNSMQRVLGGHVDVVFTGGAHVKHTDAGKTIVIGTVSDERNPDYPDVPTLKEMGVGVSTETLQLMIAPKGLPGPVLKTLRDAFLKVRSDPKVVELYRKNLRMVMDTRSPEELETYMQKLEQNYLALIKKFDKPMKKK